MYKVNPDHKKLPTTVQFQIVQITTGFVHAVQYKTNNAKLSLR